MTAKVIIKCLLEGRVKAIAPPRRGLFVITVAQLAMDSPPCQCGWLSMKPEYLMYLSLTVRGHHPRKMCMFSKQDCPMIP